MSTAFDFEARALDGNSVSLKDYAGKVLLIVNTASQCGFTPQYQGLEELWRRYKNRGFVVLGFPCNQFGGQEPGNAEQIGAFCEKNYGVSFPMFDKIDVNGSRAHPLFEHLRSKAPGIFGTTSVKWNFTKFLVDRQGVVKRRFPSMTTPQEIAREVEKLLQ